MSDVFSTLAVIGVLIIWAFFAYTVSIMHMDSGPTRTWWIAQAVLLLAATFWIYQIVRWAVTT